MVKDWIIIDCATSLPTRDVLSVFNSVSMSYPTNNLIGFSEPRLWHAVFINDYSELQPYDHQNALITYVHLHI